MQSLIREANSRTFQLDLLPCEDPDSLVRGMSPVLSVLNANVIVYDVAYPDDRLASTPLVVPDIANWLHRGWNSPMISNLYFGISPCDLYVFFVREGLPCRRECWPHEGPTSDLLLCRINTTFRSCVSMKWYTYTLQTLFKQYK